MNKTRESDSSWKLEISVKRRRSIEDRKDDEGRRSGKEEKNSSWATAFLTSVGTLATSVGFILADIASPDGSAPGYFFWFGSVLASASLLLMIVSGLLWGRSVRAQRKVPHTTGTGRPAGVANGKAGKETERKKMDVKTAGESIEDETDSQRGHVSPETLAESFACQEGEEASQLKRGEPTSAKQNVRQT